VTKTPIDADSITLLVEDTAVESCAIGYVTLMYGIFAPSCARPGATKEKL
jgi:hypothetical protein